MAITESTTTMDTLTLGEARQMMTEAIQAVTEAAVDHDEMERDPEQGSYSKSQTYAVLLMRLQQYEDASRVYKQVLAERVRRS